MEQAPIVELRAVTWVVGDQSEYGIQLRREGSEVWDWLPSWYMAFDGTLSRRPDPPVNPRT